MKTLRITLSRYAMLLVSPFVFSAAGAQSSVTEPEQVIGTIESFGVNNGIELEFDDPTRSSDFSVFFTDR